MLGIGQNRARDGQKLALALAQVAAALRKLRLVALRQAVDELVRVGQLRRRDDLFIRGVQPPVADVLHHRRDEEVRVLQHDAQLAAQIVLLHLADVHPVDADAAAVDVVKARQQVDDRRLARAGRADQGEWSCPARRAG